MEHLFYTWCQPGHSLSGGAGWGIRALSSGLPEHEGQQLVPAANYQFLDSVDPADAPVRLAYLKHASLGNIVVHGTPIGLCPGNTRSGNYFTHCLSKLDDNIDGFSAICLWDSPDWVREDFDTDPPYEEKNAGMSRVLAKPPSEIFDEVQNRLKRDTGFYENALHCLESYLALKQDETKKLHIAGTSSDIADLIKVIGACLPTSERKELTFSTYDNPDAPPEVKILGCFFSDPSREDLPEYHYQEGFFTLNTYTNRKSAAPPQDDFAREILHVMRDYGESKVEELHDFIENYNLYTTEDKQPLWGLYPPEGQPISVDDDSISKIFRWRAEFLYDLNPERREELIDWIRTNASPKSNPGQERTLSSRNWIIKNLAQLKEMAIESEQIRLLLSDLFEGNDIQVSMEYLNDFEGYLDSSIAEGARSRALYELGKFTFEENPTTDSEAIKRLADACQILEQELNILPWDDSNRLNVLLWQRLIWTCNSQSDFEELCQNFHSLVPGGDMQGSRERVSQGFLDHVAYCLYHFPHLLEESKLVKLLNLAERHALEIPPQTFGLLFQRDDWFHHLFEILNDNETYWIRIFHNGNDNNSNAVCFFERYAGEQLEERFSYLVGQGKLTRKNFDQLRNLVHGTDPEIRKRIDNYILYEYSAAKDAYQSLYDQKLESLSVDDLLDPEKGKKNYDFCFKLKATGTTRQDHPFMDNLELYNLLEHQKDNWTAARTPDLMKEFFEKYQDLWKTDKAPKFCELYVDYVYGGLNEFTALESYLGFNSKSNKPEDDALYLETKLNLLKALITKTNQQNQNDPQRKNAFAAIWFYCTCLLKDGTTGEDRKSANHNEQKPLIHFGWFRASMDIDPKTPRDVQEFVRGYFNRGYFLGNQALIQEEKKTEMHEAFKKKQIQEHYGKFSFKETDFISDESHWSKHKLFFPLVALGLAVMIVIFAIKSCSSGSVEKNNGKKPPAGNAREGE